MRAELRIHFTDTERQHIATALRIVGTTSTPIAADIRKELSLQPWDCDHIDRIFQQPAKAGYSKNTLIATDLLLDHLQIRLMNRLNSPRMFIRSDDDLDAFVEKIKKRIETVASVRHLLANALTAFQLIE